MDTRNSEKIFSYLENIHARYEQISAELSLPDTVHQQKKFRELSKELFSLKFLEEKYHQFKKMRTRRLDAETLLAAADDKEMTDFIQEEVAALNREKETLVGEVEVLMVSDPGEDNRNAFLEIRAGAGGDASLEEIFLRVTGG
ncbi:MAG TPA: PCRF domain-containing protein, partial [Acidobacteriota bacterium]